MTLVGLIQRESDPIDKLTDKSRIFIIINTIGYLFRFLHNARIPRDRLSERRMDALTCEEKDAARSFLIRRVQASSSSKYGNNFNTGLYRLGNISINSIEFRRLMVCFFLISELFRRKFLSFFHKI